MTGVGDGVWGFDPPRAHTRLPSDHPGEKKRREAGEVASRRAGANTGNCSQLDYQEQSPCQINKTNKNNILNRMRPRRRSDVNCHFGARLSIVGPGWAIVGLLNRDSARQHGYTGLILPAERVADCACLRLPGCRRLQSIELSGITLGQDDPR